LSAPDFDPSLLTRADLTAGAVAYAGPGHEAFALAVRRRNPQARVATAAMIGDLPREAFDLLVLDSLTGAYPDGIDQRLAADGTLIALVDGGPRALAGMPSFLRPARLYPARQNPDLFDDIAAAAPLDAQQPGRMVLLARRRGQPAAAPLNLQISAYSPQLSDIRARLPAQALRGDLELMIAYSGPLKAPPRPGTVLIEQRPGLANLSGWIPWMGAIAATGSLMVLEIDDHPDLIDRMAGRPGGTDYRVFSYPHAIQTSTPELAGFFRRFNPEVAVFANGVFELQPFPDRPMSPKIFYGATPRLDFPVEVARSLAPTFAAHPQAEMVVVGDRAVFDALPTARKQFHPVMSYPDYLSAMADCSILLTPLEAGLHDGKSDAKFLDAASRGLLTIASPTAYAGAVRHGETGLIAQGLSDWAPLLARALGDLGAAQAIARRAWDYAGTTRMFAHQARARRDWYRALMSRRAELEAARLERLAGTL